MKTKNALIGHTGFVGSTLLKQTNFESLYRSININEICGESFETVVCAGAPAQKWIANREPEADREKIESLIANLGAMSCKTFVLISTVDVFQNSLGADEGTLVAEAGLHPYGLHRRMLEQFVESRFENHLIVRLPGLVGPGLRKNVIFDLLNNNNLDSIESRAVFQFYPMVNLWYDIQIALGAGLKLVHLTSEPISVAEVSSRGFGKHFENFKSNSPAVYDMRTLYSKLFGTSGHYQYNRRETVQAVRSYAQSEPRTMKL